MEVAAVIVGGVSGVSVMSLFFNTFFEDKEEFFECIKFWLTPDIVSIFKGEYGEDRWAEMKLGFWIGLGVLTGFLAYFGVLKLFAE